jgi:glutamine amidotransferase
MAGDRERAPVKVPHVGWNTLERMRASTALDGICSGTAVYFTHTFAAAPTSDATAITTHGLPFASIVERGRVWGAQFHPEKSGKAGARLLENWIRRCCASA